MDKLTEGDFFRFWVRCFWVKFQERDLFGGIVFPFFRLWTHTNIQCWLAYRQHFLTLKKKKLNFGLNCPGIFFAFAISQKYSLIGLRTVSRTFLAGITSPNFVNLTKNVKLFCKGRAKKLPRHAILPNFRIHCQ